MKEAQARFEQYLKRRFGQSSTRKHYQSDLNIFRQIIGTKKPAQITATDIDTFVEHQQAAGLSPSTINRRLATLHSFFEYLASEQPAREWPNPVVSRRHRLKTGSHLPRDLSDDEVERVFAAMADERDRAIFGLMVGAGLRVGEVVSLRLSSIEVPAAAGSLAKLRLCGKGHKERMVWLSPSLWQTVQQWLQQRPAVADEQLFLNHRSRPLSVSGVQYRLKQYGQQSGVSLSCHRLRHTFARRLTESGLPVESLAKLLGHRQLHTTQRYIDGADPTVRHDFNVAMAQLEVTFSPSPAGVSEPPASSAAAPLRKASPAELGRLQKRIKETLPAWLSEALHTYLSWRWPTWRARSAYKRGNDFFGVVRRVWQWLETHRSIDGWATLRRADLEAWLRARAQAGASAVNRKNELSLLQSWWRFLEQRDYPIDPALFRVQSPQVDRQALPRYLSESDYQRLVQTVLDQTAADTYDASLDRAWFLTLAHTGIRISELIDLHLADVNLTTGYLLVRGGKPGRDRVVYLTPTTIAALERYLARRPDVPGLAELFVVRRRSPCLHTIRLRLKHYGELAEIQVTPHQLRHTLATRLINQGMPIHSLRKLLGHQHLDQTQIYAQVYDETLYQHFTQAMAQLEGIAVQDWPRPGLSEPLIAEHTTLPTGSG